MKHRETLVYPALNSWLRLSPASLKPVQIFALTLAGKENGLCIPNTQYNP